MASNCRSRAGCLALRTRKLLRLSAALSALLLVSSCANIPGAGLSAQIAAANTEATQIARSVIPITSPLKLQYRPMPSTPDRAEASQSLNGRTVSAVMPGAISVVRDGSGFLLTYTIKQIESGSNIIGCGSEPVLSQTISFEGDGHTLWKRTHPTPGCAVSEKASRELDSPMNYALYKFPPEGVTTGTTIELQNPLSTISFHHYDFRLIVAGQTDWHGRPVLVLRIAGCAEAKSGNDSVSVCPTGISLVDMATAIQIGSIMTIEAESTNEKMAMVMRIYPTDH